MSETKTSKLNIGLAISRNFNKITLELKEEPIEYSNNEELKANVRQIFGILKAEIELEYAKMKK